jgi:branched-chain amino acid transport system substrate-binding protein
MGWKGMAWAIVIGLIVVMTPLAEMGIQAQPVSPTAEVFLVGAALPMTGDLSPQGKEQKEGYELWKKVANEKGGMKVGSKTYRVDIKYYDYASDINTAVKLVEKLIVEDKIKFILGPYGSASLIATGSIAEKYGVIHMAPSGAAPKVYEGRRYTFGTLSASANYGGAWLEAIAKVDPKAKTLAILARNDLWPLDVANSVKDRASQYNTQVVFFSTYPVGTKDLSTSLTQIKGKQPELFFFSGYANDAMLAIRQAKQVGLKVKAFGATAGLTSPDFLNGMKEEANEITSVESWFPNLPETFRDDVFGSPKDFERLYRQVYGYPFDPPYITASGAACGLLIQKCIERTKSMDPAVIREELAKFNEMTFYGPIKFTPNGQLDRRAYALQIQYPKTICVTPGLETGKFNYPMP